MSITQHVKGLYLSEGAGGALGTRVVRAAAADPQNVWLNIFTVAGGWVLLTGLIGVRTVIQAGGASNMQFRSSVGNTVMCVAAAITGNAVGTIYSITGNPAGALIIGAAGILIMDTLSAGGAGLLIPTGTIQITMTAAAGTGSTRYVLHYIPVDARANVIAA